MDATGSVDRKVHLISLGCARNRADSEVMLGTLIDDNWKVTQDADDADAVIINTCGFIGPAKEESINTILEAAQLKQAKPDMKLVVTGCMTQRYKRQLSEGLPEVDLFVGTDEFPSIGEYLSQDLPKGTVHAKRTHYLYDGSLPKKNTLSSWSAYVKVAEGCQHNCAFCIIPAIRGQLRSRPIPSVLKEARQLASQGVREINLIAQDLAAFGRDWGSSDLLPLLRELVAVDGLSWIRMLYMYPENISDEFIEFFAANEKLVKYLDIPIQHASDRILQSMNRDVSRQDIEMIISKLRQAIPDIAIRTSVMVGFPGETEEDFQELKEFVATQKFEHLGCFSYSQEEGTVAGRMLDQVDEDIKSRRLDEIMSLQQQISREKLASYVGRELPVLVLGASEETELLMEARLATQAPEVDGIVYINDGDYKVGDIQICRITEAHDYDLVGHIVSKSGI